jgi:hypothetical protein
LKTRALIILLLVMTACTPERSQGLLQDLMRAEEEFYGPYLRQAGEYRLQIIYTRIDRDSANRPRFTHHRYRADTGEYFYPASTVKLPILLLALEKLNGLGVEGLNKYTSMFTDSACCRQTRTYADSTSPDGMPSVANYIRRILLVSDNEASNRLYEFVGQEELHRRLAAKGYPGVRLVHRLSVPLSAEENLAMNPVRFVREGETLYAQAASVSAPLPATGAVPLGRGYLEGDSLVLKPMDFSAKNRLSLEDLHRMLIAVIFPEGLLPAQRFDLSEDDYRFVRQYMGQWPGETRFPVGVSEHDDGYVKFFLLGGSGARPAGSLRIFNKVGLAYGFLIDAAYICDPATGLEFLLSAAMCVNQNGIFNDDRYEYDSLGFPFFRQLGATILRHESQRQRGRRADLSAFEVPFGRDSIAAPLPDGITEN